MRIAEHRQHARGLADLLLYDSLIEDGIILQQDGSLMTALVVSRTGHGLFHAR